MFTDALLPGIHPVPGPGLTADEVEEEMFNWLGPQKKKAAAPTAPRAMDAAQVAQQLQQQRQRETAPAAAVSTRCLPRLYPTDIEGDSVPGAPTLLCALSSPSLV